MRKSKKETKAAVREENLDRFAGSSDEEENDHDEEEVGANDPTTKDIDVVGATHDEDDDEQEDENHEEEDDDSFPQDEFSEGLIPTKQKDGAAAAAVDPDDDDDDSSLEGGEADDAASKMASAMGRILGTRTITKTSRKKRSATSSEPSVVLSKTVTPLQRLQQQEREKEKKLREKRLANRERNLTALHLPLSIATTNALHAGNCQLSVAKELEQERFHRRVATRGVVALFNAISQHQKSTTEVGNVASSFG
jgi:Rrp15p